MSSENAGGAHVAVAYGGDGCHDKPDVVPKINVLRKLRNQRDFAYSQAVRRYESAE